MLAAFHGPVEEQARLSLHPHMPLWFVSNVSEAWLRSVLVQETADAQQLLRGWQERVLAAVQSMQLDSAAVLPLLLSSEPSAEELILIGQGRALQDRWESQRKAHPATGTLELTRQL